MHFKVTETQCKVVVMLDKALTSRSSVGAVLDVGSGSTINVEEIKIKNNFTLLATVPLCLFARSSLGICYVLHEKFFCLFISYTTRISQIGALEKLVY